jgi:hypothetical protein
MVRADGWLELVDITVARGGRDVIRGASADVGMGPRRIERGRR